MITLQKSMKLMEESLEKQLKQGITEILKEMENLREENNLLKQKILIQDRYINNMDRELRSKNLVIKGIADGDETREETAEQVRKMTEK